MEEILPLHSRVRRKSSTIYLQFTVFVPPESLGVIVRVEGIFTEGGGNESPALEASSSQFLPDLMALSKECMELVRSGWPHNSTELHPS